MSLTPVSIALSRVLNNSDFVVLSKDKDCWGELMGSESIHPCQGYAFETVRSIGIRILLNNWGYRYKNNWEFLFFINLIK